MRVVVVAAVAALGSLVLFRHIHLTSFAGDESGWISSGNYHAGLLLRGDFQPDDWDCVQCEAWDALNMQLGKLLVALPLGIGPRSRDRDFFAFYDFDASYDDNLERGLVPPPDVLSRARAGSAAFAVLCCLLILTLGYVAQSPWTGLIGAALLLANRLFVATGSRAMTDVHYDLFLVASALAASVLLKRSGRASLAWASCGFGIAAGLACSVKITGIAITGALFLGVIVYKQVAGRLRLADAALGAGVLCATSMAVVYGLNPWFWPAFDRVSAGDIARELSSLAGVLRGEGHGAPNLFILCFLPLNWNRYYLPAVVAGHVLAAIAIGDVMRRAHGAAAGLSKSRPGAPEAA